MHVLLIAALALIPWHLATKGPDPAAPTVRNVNRVVSFHFSVWDRAQTAEDRWPTWADEPPDPSSRLIANNRDVAVFITGSDESFCLYAAQMSERTLAGGCFYTPTMVASGHAIIGTGQPADGCQYAVAIPDTYKLARTHRRVTAVDDNGAILTNTRKQHLTSPGRSTIDLMAPAGLPC